MPDVRNCRRCGKIYNHIGRLPICLECRKLDDEDFKRVKEYLYDNPGASINQVSVELEISVQRIKGYLKEGRLEIVGEGGNLILECESCGRSIRTGRFCNECSNGLSSEFKSASEQINKSAQSADKKGHGMKYVSKRDL
ncbi:MAG: MerR family transcriptional regulator [Clostridiaceae bacterium]|nr:MerR family transcriptional regulator [Clostridiaceae bacterium]